MFHTGQPYYDTREESGGSIEMRDVDPSEATNYLTKSEEFLEMAKLATQNAKYNSTVTVPSVHWMR